MHLPVLTTGSHQARTPLPDSDADLISEQLGIVTDVTQLPANHVPSPSQPLVASRLRLRNHPIAPSTALSCHADLQPTHGTLTAEGTLFPFLFPHGPKVYTPSYGQLFYVYATPDHSTVFTLTILQTTATRNHAARLEAHYIQHYRTIGSDGYNLLRSAGSTSSQFRYLQDRGHL